MPRRLLLCLMLALLSCGASRAETAAQILQRNKALPDYSLLHGKLDNYGKSMIWVFIGNSVTQGAMHTHGGRSYEEHISEIIRWEYKRGMGDRKGDLFINAAESGEGTRAFFEREEWQLQQFKADVVFIYLGNKVSSIEEYQSHLTTIVRHIRKQGAIPVLEVPCPSPSQTNSYASVRAVADREDCLLVDHHAYWHELVGGNGDKPEWKNNAMHPNAAGHLVMAHAIVKELGIEPNGSRVLALPIPHMPAKPKEADAAPPPASPPASESESQDKETPARKDKTYSARELREKYNNILKRKRRPSHKSRR